MEAMFWEVYGRIMGAKLLARGKQAQITDLEEAMARMSSIVESVEKQIEQVVDLSPEEASREFKALAKIAPWLQEIEARVKADDDPERQALQAISLKFYERMRWLSDDLFDVAVSLNPSAASMKSLNQVWDSEADQHWDNYEPKGE